MTRKLRTPVSCGLFVSGKSPALSVSMICLWEAGNCTLSNLEPGFHIMYSLKFTFLEVTKISKFGWVRFRAIIHKHESETRLYEIYHLHLKFRIPNTLTVIHKYIHTYIYENR